MLINLNENASPSFDFKNSLTAALQRRKKKRGIYPINDDSLQKKICRHVVARQKLDLINGIPIFDPSSNLQPIMKKEKSFTDKNEEFDRRKSWSKED